MPALTSSCRLLLRSLSLTICVFGAAWGAAAEPAPGAGPAASAAAPASAALASATSALSAPDQAALDAVAAHWGGLRSLRATFTRRTAPIVPDPSAPPPVTMQGRLVWATGDRYSLIVRDAADPDALQRWCSDGVTRWEQERFDKDNIETRAKSATSEDPVLRRMLACARMDIAVLGRDFFFAIERPRTDIALRLILTPRHADTARDIVRIVIDLDAQRDPQSVHVDTPQGERMAHVLTALQRNPVIDPSEFTVPASARP